MVAGAAAEGIEKSDPLLEHFAQGGKGTDALARCLLHHRNPIREAGLFNAKCLIGPEGGQHTAVEAFFRLEQLVVFQRVGRVVRGA